jgi:hypothetical protein
MTQLPDLASINSSRSVADPNASGFLETSRFQEEENQPRMLLSCYTIESNKPDQHKSHSMSRKSSVTSRAKIVHLNSEFTLQPYEDQINCVSTKIHKIEQDLAVLDL